MCNIVNPSLPASGLCKSMFGHWSQREEVDSLEIPIFPPFQTQNRNDSQCLSDCSSKIAPQKEYFFVCVIVHTGFVL